MRLAHGAGPENGITDCIRRRGRSRGRALEARACLVAVAILLARGAAAQPDWLPEEVKATPPAAAARAPVDPDDPCADPLVAEPLAPPVRDSGFDRAQSACLSGSFSLRGREAAVFGEAGDTRATSAALDIRWLYLADLELAIGARAVQFEESDAIAEDDTRFGPVRAGAAAGRKTRALGRSLRLAWSLRFDLPWTDSGDGPGPTLSASPQVAAAMRLGRRLAGHARIAALLGLARPPDDVQTRRAMALSADLAWAPWRHLAGGLGVEAQSGWHGFGLDHFLLRGGLRIPLGQRARIDLTSAAPLAGREPTDLVVELGLTFAR